MATADKGVVLVTGASGFIAGSVVQLLLERGYKVRGTVRSLADETKVSHLRELFPALQLFEADLLTEGSFDEACKGYLPSQISGLIIKFLALNQDYRRLNRQLLIY
jgi:uncharacterized protein YbjT (DUF2867 family)